MKRISLIVLFAGILTASAAFAQTNTPPNVELTCSPGNCAASLFMALPDMSASVGLIPRSAEIGSGFDAESCRQNQTFSFQSFNCDLVCKWEGSVFTSSETVYSKDNCRAKNKSNFRTDQTVRFYVKDPQGLVASDSVFVNVSPDIPTSIKNIGGYLAPQFYTSWVAFQQAVDQVKCNVSFWPALCTGKNKFSF